MSKKHRIAVIDADVMGQAHIKYITNEEPGELAAIAALCLRPPRWDRALGYPFLKITRP